MTPLSSALSTPIYYGQMPSVSSDSPAVATSSPAEIKTVIAITNEVEIKGIEAKGADSSPRASELSERPLSLFEKEIAEVFQEVRERNLRIAEEQKRNEPARKAEEERLYQEYTQSKEIMPLNETTAAVFKRFKAENYEAAIQRFVDAVNAERDAPVDNEGLYGKLAYAGLSLGDLTPAICEKITVLRLKEFFSRMSVVRALKETFEDGESHAVLDSTFDKELAFISQFPNVKCLALWSSKLDRLAGNCRNLERLELGGIGECEMRLFDMPQLRHLKINYQGLDLRYLPANFDSLVGLELHGTNVRGDVWPSFRNLQTLSISYLSTYGSLNVSNLPKNLDSVTSFTLDHVNFLGREWPSFAGLKSLTLNTVSNINGLVTSYDINAENLPDLNRVESLILIDTGFIGNKWPSLRSLKSLSLGNHSAEILSLGGMPNLNELVLYQSRKVTTITTTESLRDNLRKLRIARCSSLSSIPDFKKLEKCEIQRCPKVPKEIITKLSVGIKETRLPVSIQFDEGEEAHADSKREAKAPKVAE